MAAHRADEDVIALLQRQHEEIRELFDAVVRARDDERQHVFAQLVRLLAIHETAEEEVVHPAVRSVPGGDAVVDARIGEEHRAKEMLTSLERLGPDAEGFDLLLQQLREDVLTHAEHEEREEFPLLRAGCDAQHLVSMAASVRAAEAIAPTHPHPGVESAKANLLLGPPLAIMDRARDAIRKVSGRG
jgi:hemerythrin superfamily protein